LGLALGIAASLQAQPNPAAAPDPPGPSDSARTPDALHSYVGFHPLPAFAGLIKINYTRPLGGSWFMRLVPALTVKHASWLHSGTVETYRLEGHLLYDFQGQPSAGVYGGAWLGVRWLGITYDELGQPTRTPEGQQRLFTGAGGFVFGYRLNIKRVQLDTYLGGQAVVSANNRYAAALYAEQNRFAHAFAPFDTGIYFKFGFAVNYRLLASSPL
jgi:hypothetical protein